MIYVIASGPTGRRHVKIGRSVDPAVRLSELQIGSRSPLRLLATGPGDAQREKALHHEFARYRKHGEWFAIPAHETDRLLAMVRGDADPPRTWRLERNRRAREARLKAKEAVRAAGVLPRDGGGPTRGRMRRQQMDDAQRQRMLEKAARATPAERVRQEREAWS